MVNATPEVAKAMVNEGYADMFVDFLDEKDRPETIEFYVAVVGDLKLSDMITGETMQQSGKDYRVTTNSYSESCWIETETGTPIRENLEDFLYDMIDNRHTYMITKVSPKAAKALYDMGYKDTFKKYLDDKSIEKGE